MVKMNDINDFNYTGDGVDRSRWKADADGVDRSRWNFDENGFQLATNAALETARRQMILAAEAENAKQIHANEPNAYSRDIDGVDAATDDAFKL
jgi:hypothetical protein